MFKGNNKDTRNPLCHVILIHYVIYLTHFEISHEIIRQLLNIAIKARNPRCPLNFKKLDNLTSRPFRGNLIS